MKSTTEFRNLAIIAHVDHGKTTLLDKLLEQTGGIDSRAQLGERVMDSYELEKERGITIRAKNTALRWQDYTINIVDTPGHADFGGEVERVLSLVDSVLLLVDAVDGPMPQTRFVTQKAFEHGFTPIVLINKIDRPAARPDWVIDQVFELFDKLGATDQQLDFPIMYSSAIEGIALKHMEDYENMQKTAKGQVGMQALLELIIQEVPVPQVELKSPFRMQVNSLDHSPFLGAIAIGKIQSGKVTKNMPIKIIDSKSSDSGTLKTKDSKVIQILALEGLRKTELTEAIAGDIVALAIGIEKLNISDCICAPEKVELMPVLKVDRPTIRMGFIANDSPFSGREAKHSTSRKLEQRLHKELLNNVALSIEPAEDKHGFLVSGRGELHLSILVETMRREGFELAITRPQIITKREAKVLLEPYEELVLDIQEEYQGIVIEKLGQRKGLCQSITPSQSGQLRLDYLIPSRGLIGFRNEFLTITLGTGLLFHVFHSYRPYISEEIGQRKNGGLIAMQAGKATAESIFNLQKNGKFFIDPGTEVYEGMLIGMHNRENDLVVNVCKGKQLTNMRASGSDENVVLTPPIRFNLEEAIAFINDDELLEVTPKSLRIRKRLLTATERKKQNKNANKPLNVL